MNAVKRNIMVLVAISIVAVGSIVALNLMQSTDIDPTNSTTTTTSTNEGTALTVNITGLLYTYAMSDLKSMDPITGNGGYKKTTGTIVGPFEYTGVSIRSLLNEIGGLPESYSIGVSSRDGYTPIFNKSQVEGILEGYDPEGNPFGAINCTLIIAYYENGSALTEGGPLRAVILNEDGNLSDGPLWAKDVVSITVFDDST
ncbi:MAG: hypothetical protein RTU92_02945 [Candidatus Thorarchaeota archaeon]